jgi:CDP-diglyceride synthetase
MNDGASIVPGGAGPFLNPYRDRRMGGDARLRRAFLCPSAFVESSQGKGLLTAKRGSVNRRAERALFLTAPILIAGLAHVAVITLDLAPGLARPIDAGRRWRGGPLLGSNKTWRGFVVMPAATAITIAAQQALTRRSPRLATLAPLARGAPPSWMVGAICGAAYVLAELPNSFTKRRFGIAPGTSARRARIAQYLVDQVDSVVGCVVAIRLFYRIDAADAGASALLGAAFHVAVERTMRLLPRGPHAPR